MKQARERAFIFPKQKAAGPGGDWDYIEAVRQLAAITVLVAILLPSVASAATTPAQAPPAQAPPAQAPPSTGPSSIPLSSEPSKGPSKAVQKKQKDNLYAFLVIGCALLPIAGFALWKLLGSHGAPATKYQPYRYSAGPADNRRMKRRAQPKKPKDKKKKRYYG